MTSLVCKFHFVARKVLLSRLEKFFERSATTSSRLIGMGGAGKSQVALEYCRRMKDSGNFRAIFWLNASSRNALYSSVEIIAKRLFPNRALDNPHAAVTLMATTSPPSRMDWLRFPDETSQILTKPLSPWWVINDTPITEVVTTHRHSKAKFHRAIGKEHQWVFCQRETVVSSGK
jgi:hypothetical protein